MTQSILSIEKLSISIGGSRILREVSLDLPSNHVFCLMGRNGVGTAVPRWDRLCSPGPRNLPAFNGGGKSLYWRSGQKEEEDQSGVGPRLRIVPNY